MSISEVKFYGAKTKCGARGVLDFGPFGMLTKIVRLVTGKIWNFLIFTNIFVTHNF